MTIKGARPGRVIALLGIFLCTVVAALTGCTSSAGCLPISARGTGLEVQTVAGSPDGADITGPSPLTVGAALASAAGPVDGGLNATQLITKAELDFGDGAGWTDVTGRQQALGAQWGSSLAQSQQHVYAAPGQYTLRGRVTYWDGQVLDAWNPYTITVAP